MLGNNAHANLRVQQMEKVHAKKFRLQRRRPKKEDKKDLISNSLTQEKWTTFEFHKLGSIGNLGCRIGVEDGSSAHPNVAPFCTALAPKKNRGTRGHHCSEALGSSQCEDA